MKITRLRASDVALARTMLVMMAEVLDDPGRQPLEQRLPDCSTQSGRGVGIRRARRPSNRSVV